MLNTEGNKFTTSTTPWDRATVEQTFGLDTVQGGTVTTAGIDMGELAWMLGRSMQNITHALFNAARVAIDYCELELWDIYSDYEGYATFENGALAFQTWHPRLVPDQMLNGKELGIDTLGLLGGITGAVAIGYLGAVPTAKLIGGYFGAKRQRNKLLDQISEELEIETVHQRLDAIMSNTLSNVPSEELTSGNERALVNQQLTHDMLRAILDSLESNRRSVARDAISNLQTKRISLLDQKDPSALSG